MFNNYNSLGLTTANHNETGDPHPQYSRAIHKTILTNGLVGNYVKIASIKLGSNGEFTGKYLIFNTANYLENPFGELSIRIHTVSNVPTSNLCYNPLTLNYPSPFNAFCTFYNIANGETTVDIYMKIASNNVFIFIADIFKDSMYQTSYATELKTRERVDLDFLLDDQPSDTLANIEALYTNAPVFNKVMGLVQVQGIDLSVLPTPSADYRGTNILLRKYNGTDDEMYVCIRLADNTYAWKKVSLV
jgi:hypothetical protein